MLINRVHIYIFGILKHQGLIPCTRFWGVKRLPAEKVLKETVHVPGTGQTLFLVMFHKEVRPFFSGPKEVCSMGWRFCLWLK